MTGVVEEPTRAVCLTDTVPLGHVLVSENDIGGRVLRERIESDRETREAIL